MHSHKDQHRLPEIPVGECVKLYKGTKSYWRTGESIDIAVFEHHAPGNVITKGSSYWIEIIAYNPTLDVEAPHLYIESMKLCHRFNEKAVKNQTQNFLFSMQDDVIPGQKVAQALYLKYIMNRLAIVHGDGDDTAIPEEIEAYASETPSQKKRDFAITLVPKGDETWSAQEPIFTLEKPLGLHVLPDLKHQRRGSGTPGEFENTVAHIRRDSVEIERSLMEAGHFEHVLSEEFKKKVVVANNVADRDHTTNPATGNHHHQHIEYNDYPLTKILSLITHLLLFHSNARTSGCSSYSRASSLHLSHRAYRRVRDYIPTHLIHFSRYYDTLVILPITTQSDSDYQDTTIFFSFSPS